MAMAELHDGDAGEEVEIFVAVGVPELRAFAANELDRAAAVGRHQVVTLERLKLAHGHARSAIFVPMPTSVNSSSNTLCGLRPSTMCALGTPPSTAARHASSFARMPPPTFASELRRPSGRENEISWPSGSSHPSTSVRKMIL